MRTFARWVFGAVLAGTALSLSATGAAQLDQPLGKARQGSSSSNPSAGPGSGLPTSDIASAI